MRMTMRLKPIQIAVLVLAAVVAPAYAQNSANEQRRDQWQKVDDIFLAMGVRPGAVVADVGAGGGYFTTRLSRAVGDAGRVYAVDIGADVIRRLRDRVSAEGLKNVEPVQGTADDPKLPPATLDAALIVNAYHEMKEHQAMLAKLKTALKPDGRLVIVEPISASRRSGSREQQTRNHEIGVDYVMQDAHEAGFARLQIQDPFTKRSDGHGDEEWLLVLTPAPASTQTDPRDAAGTASLTEAREREGGEREREQADRKDEWKSPALRITPEEFKRLRPDEVLVLDARDPESYRRGHLPGAVLMTPEELSKPEAAARLKLEKRRIITYCS